MTTRFLLLARNNFLLRLFSGVLLFMFAVCSIRAQDLVWARSAGGISLDTGAGIAVDALGNSLVTGSFQGAAVFGAGEPNETTLNSTDFLDVFVAKYNINGNLLWARQAGGPQADGGGSIAVDASGNSCITGLFEDSLTFGAGEINQTTLASVGSRDIFVAKFDSDGLLLWAKQAGGSNSNDHAEGIAVDASNNIYVTGFFNDSTIFGAGEVHETVLSSSGSFDIYIASYASDGLLQWAKQAGSASFDIGVGVAAGDSDNSWVTGFFEGVATFGAGETNETILTSSNGNDFFVAKYDVDGSLLWAKRAGGSGNDEGYGIVTDLFGNSYVTGHFQGAATFGAGEINETILTSQGEADVLLAKYDTDGLFAWATAAGGSGDDRGYAVVVDTSGKSYITGQIHGAATFGFGEINETTLTSLGANDIFVAEYTSNGQLLWSRQAGGYFSGSGSGDFGADIALDASGNSYITGQFQGIAILASVRSIRPTWPAMGPAIFLSLNTERRYPWTLLRRQF